MQETPEIPESYLRQINSAEPTYLKELERETYLKILRPHMLTGFTQGRFLSFLSKQMKPGRILEIGTFTGYGSLCLAEGLSNEGLLFTIDCSEENVWLARKYFTISPYNEKIRLLTGKAEDLVPTLNEPWDLVYIDADKKNNLTYLKLVWPNLKVGGVVLIDNVFAHGAVLKPASEQKTFETAVAEMNLLLPEILPDAMVLTLPIRDGLSVIRKEELTNFQNRS